MFSPASIAAALQMALCGARGETAAQLAAALHLPGPDTAADGLRLLADELNASSDGAEVTLRVPKTRRGSRRACRCRPNSPASSVTPPR